MFKKFIKNQNGIIMSIEFAIIVPIFLLLFLMFIELSRLLYISTILDSIAIDGSYYAAKTNDLDKKKDLEVIFYNKVSKEQALWSLVSTVDDLEINVAYCSLVKDATDYLNKNGGNCYASPFGNALVVFSVGYKYHPILTNNALVQKLRTTLVRHVVVFKEY
ncbi:MAG: pilus assembly protein [Candidatus Schmidhempelia sp.]|nr:pilus assembly protein [Candidatus Schmidhempelia sp.]